MKSIINKILFGIFVFTLLVSVSSVYAAESTITFKGLDEGFKFGPGSIYSDTDMFENFKEVMPGDKLIEEITFTNSATDCDYVKLYLTVEIKDEETEDINESDKSVVSMEDFLAKLTMRIYNKDEIVYETKLDKFNGNKQNIYLGKYNSGEQTTLRVELDVPSELGNEYANKAGEVDWLFILEAFNSPNAPEIDDSQVTVRKIWLDNGVDRPESIKVNLLRNNKVYDTITLDKSNQWMYTWTKLDEDYTWKVEEVVPSGYIVEYEKEGNIVFITNVLENLVLEGNTKPDPTSLSVVKKWSGDEDSIKNRPTKVKVTLYDGKDAIESVWLGDWNNWSYTWEELDGSGNYSIIEDDIPKGYTPSYSVKENTVTITNTATLIETGQNYYPAIILFGVGILIIIIGILYKKKKNEE